MGLSEYQRWEASQEFRQAMHNAYINGYGDACDRAPMRFDRWFDKNYGDIIGIGTEAPASEKMSVKEEIDDDAWLDDHSYYDSPFG